MSYIGAIYNPPGGAAGSPGAAGANGNASGLLVAGSYDTWIPGIGMFSGPNGTGTPVTADNTAIGSWVGIYNGQILNANGTITYHSAGYLSKPAGSFLQSANTITSTVMPVTVCMNLNIISQTDNTSAICAFDSPYLRCFVNNGGSNEPQIQFTDNAQFRAVTDTNYVMGTTGMSPWTFTFAQAPVVYQGTNATQSNVTYNTTGTALPATNVGGHFFIGADNAIGTYAQGVFQIGAVSLYLSGLTTGNTGQIAQMSTSNTATIAGAPWLSTPLAPPNTFAGQANTTIAANPTLQAALNAAPGSYGGLVRDVSAAGSDQSTAIQAELTSNHHVVFAERAQRTGQHLLFVDDGFVDGNHATIFGSAAYTALEEDWILGISATVGGGAFTMNDPIIQNLFHDASAVVGIRDGTSYGAGPPTKSMAGLWFGDLQSKPGSAAGSVAHGRVLGGGARGCTYGLRLTGFQYSRAMDGRYEFNDVGVLVESANGEGNVDLKLSDIQLGENLIGVLTVANNTQQGFQGPFQNITIEGGKHNGQNAGSVCHYATISPWWRDGVHFQTGSPVLRDAGTEFLLNDVASYWSVGRTVPTKTFDTTVNTAGYPLGGTTPAPNLDGQAFVRQNANSTWWMCWYVPVCSYYVEGTKQVYDRCHPADNFGGYCGTYRMGPYGTADIIDPGSSGLFTGYLTRADHPTGRALMSGNASGISGYAQNLDKWPDTFVYSGSAFAFFLAGGLLPELEVYRVIQGNQPSWHPSALSPSHQDNISEATATRSPAFPALLQSTGTGVATTFSKVVASEGIFSGRNVTQMVYGGTHLTTLGTCSQITTANNQPITPTFSVAAPANGQLCVIDTEVFYVISGGGTTAPTLARAQQNTVPTTHAANATVQTVGAYLDAAGTGQQITTNWLGGYGSASVPAVVDTSAFIFIHNTSGAGFWLNFDAFWSGNSKYSNGNTRNDAFIGRCWVGPHQHARLSFGKGSYSSDYKFCWCFDALQAGVTCYVSGQMMYQSPAGLDSAGHTRMMQRGEWVRNSTQ